MRQLMKFFLLALLAAPMQLVPSVSVGAAGLANGMPAGVGTVQGLVAPVQYRRPYAAPPRPQYRRPYAVPPRPQYRRRYAPPPRAYGRRYVVPRPRYYAPPQRRQYAPPPRRYYRR